MYSCVIFYKKVNELHEIYFPVRLGSLKEANASGENSDIPDYNENFKKYIS